MNEIELSQKLQSLESVIVDRIIVMKAANLGLVIIRERTTSGKYLPGSSPGVEEYSTNTFARPLGGLGKQFQNALLKSNSVEVFKKDGGSTWITITGGYKKFRELAGKESSKVSMIWTGRMMRNLGILNAANDSATLGFKSAEEKQKAEWHNILGAGKSKRKHVFMGFTDSEKLRITNLVGEEVMKRLSMVFN